MFSPASDGAATLWPTFRETVSTVNAILGGSAPGTVTLSSASAPPVERTTMSAVPGDSAVTRPPFDTVTTDASSDS